MCVFVFVRVLAKSYQSTSFARITTAARPCHDRILPVLCNGPNLACAYFLRRAGNYKCRTYKKKVQDCGRVQQTSDRRNMGGVQYGQRLNSRQTDDLAEVSWHGIVCNEGIVDETMRWRYFLEP